MQLVYAELRQLAAAKMGRESAAHTIQPTALVHEVWLLSPADNDYLRSIMTPVHEPGKVAHWIAPPRKGIGGQDPGFAYVRA